MKAMMELQYLLEEELEKIAKKGDISPVELERVDKAVDIIKDIETICAMREYEVPEVKELAYSGRIPYYAREGGRGSYSYAPMMGGSYRDGRSSMAGGYASREMDPCYYADGRSYGYGGGYSGHMKKEELKMDLKEMMNSAVSDKERMAIQQLLDSWKD